MHHLPFWRPSWAPGHDGDAPWLKLVLAVLAALAGVGGGLACGAWTVDGDGLLIDDVVAPAVKEEVPTVLSLEWDEKNQCWHER